MLQHWEDGGYREIMKTPFLQHLAIGSRGWKSRCEHGGCEESMVRKENSKCLMETLPLCGEPKGRGVKVVYEQCPWKSQFWKWRKQELIRTKKTRFLSCPHF